MSIKKIITIVSNGNKIKIKRTEKLKSIIKDLKILMEKYSFDITATSDENHNVRFSLVINQDNSDEIKLTSLVNYRPNFDSFTYHQKTKLTLSNIVKKYQESLPIPEIDNDNSEKRIKIKGLSIGDKVLFLLQ